MKAKGPAGQVQSAGRLPLLRTSSQWPPPPQALTPAPGRAPTSAPTSTSHELLHPHRGGPPAPIPLSPSLLEQGCQGSGRWLG